MQECFSFCHHVQNYLGLYLYSTGIISLVFSRYLRRVQYLFQLFLHSDSKIVCAGCLTWEFSWWKEIVGSKELEWLTSVGACSSPWSQGTGVRWMDTGVNSIGVGCIPQGDSNLPKWPNPYSGSYKISPYQLLYSLGLAFLNHSCKPLAIWVLSQD